MKVSLAPTGAERAFEMPGDRYLLGGPSARVVMTRAVSLAAPPDRVWPWVAQMGRGAGWYSYDRLDNGGQESAWHIVSWIPNPHLGDATAIGYLRRIEEGSELTWWADGVRFAGSRARLVMDIRLEPEGRGTRLISRNSADASGWSGTIAIGIFRLLDAIMARRHLRGIRDRVEAPESIHVASRERETGERDQYQLYEVLYGVGGQAGVSGREQAARWRQASMEDGYLGEDR